ncbi:hypothetical protein MBAV_000755 [Candidatus Magnetobacterium bavaricum]|uniref:Uncharacterized protein n=1 Tax=Candidatus Magnetobacterium bavaricum TaxID=29290 RepID=A0A0F3GYU1_9BACT|nr:hypothetical protein MBAV_000755 [Candidatus Magnetobacterium bavaricum]
MSYVQRVEPFESAGSFGHKPVRFLFPCLQMKTGLLFYRHYVQSCKRWEIPGLVQRFFFES